MKLISLLLVQLALTLPACATEKPELGGSTDRLTVDKAAESSRLDGALKMSISVEKIPSPDAWGGDVQCAGVACDLALVEHDTGYLVVYRMEEAGAREIDRHKLAHHPDSAKWIATGLIAAAVEGTAAVEFYRLEKNKLIKINSQYLGFQPREVTVLHKSEKIVTLLATPYSGDEVRYIEYNPVENRILGAAAGTLCAAPWYPSVLKRKNLKQYLISVGCLDDKKVIEAELTISKMVINVEIKNTIKGKYVPRQVAYDEATDEIYVAEELGGNASTYQRLTQATKRIPLGADGAYSVALGKSGYIALGRSDDVLIVRKMPDQEYLKIAQVRTSGLPERIYWLPSDISKQLRLLVLNSAGSAVDHIKIDFH